MSYSRITEDINKHASTLEVVDPALGDIGVVEERMADMKVVENKEENVLDINTEKEVADEIVKPEKVVKHMLENAWTLWFFKNDKSRTWEENQRPIITVTTVEDFWRLYNNISVASRLPPGSDYSLFKEGIFPDWEDHRNAAGGRWIINVDRQHRVQVLDNYWLEILFYLIGEHAANLAHIVNGAVVNVRGKGDKLAVWMADTGTNVIKVGKEIKQRLGIKEEQTIAFNTHREEKVRSHGGNNKKKYFV